jgi:hypothetical protein
LMQRARQREDCARVLASWKGYMRTSRDFQFGNNIFVEVKTTVGFTSEHDIGSVQQVDPRRDGTGSPVEQLYLCSVLFIGGLDRSDTDVSLAGMVEKLLLRLQDIDGGSGEMRQLLLARIGQYGGLDEGGYNHKFMATVEPYTIAWEPYQLRLYDMNDRAVEVLRLADVRERGHVVPRSVRYSIALPEEIHPGVNPVESPVDLLAGLLLT